MSGEAFTMRSVRRLLLVAGATGVLGLAGCSQGSVVETGSAATAETTMASGDEIALPLTSVSPLDEFMGSGTGPRSAARYNEIFQGRISACAGAQGFTYAAVAAETSSAQSFTPTARIEDAKVSGYGLLHAGSGDPSGVQAAQFRANQKVASELSDTDLERYKGVVSACHKAAAAELDKFFPVMNRELNAATFEAKKGIESSPEYETAVEQWSACMATKSQPYSSPGAARGSFNEAVEKWTNVPQEAERELVVATADAECSLDTIWPVVQKLEQGVVDDLVREYGDAACGAPCVPKDSVVDAPR